MDTHRIRMTDIPGDPIPVLFVEIAPETWIDVNITLAEYEDLHCNLHQFLTDMEMERSSPITWNTRAFNLYQIKFEESIIE